MYWIGNGTLTNITADGCTNISAASKIAVFLVILPPTLWCSCHWTLEPLEHSFHRTIWLFCEMDVREFTEFVAWVVVRFLKLKQFSLRSFFMINIKKCFFIVDSIKVLLALHTSYICLTFPLSMTSKNMV